MFCSKSPVHYSKDDFLQTTQSCLYARSLVSAPLSLLSNKSNCPPPPLPPSHILIPLPSKIHFYAMQLLYPPLVDPYYIYGLVLPTFLPQRSLLYLVTISIPHYPCPHNFSQLSPFLSMALVATSSPFCYTPF